MLLDEQFTNDAIEAVLVAIAIPIFNSQLEKSREATDIANIRSAYAEATVKLLDSDASTTATADTPPMVSTGAIEKIDTTTVIGGVAAGDITVSSKAAATITVDEDGIVKIEGGATYTRP